jgi:multicomponent Na+:H+ antiporter subunit D
MIDFAHPALLFVLGAVPIPFLKDPIRRIYLVLVPLLGLLAVVTMQPGSYGATQFLGQDILIARVDKLSIVFATVFAIMALIGTVYALHLSHPGQHVAAFVYVGSSLGVVFAGDYLTLYLFWEIMAFASAYLVFAQGGQRAIGAGFRYLMVHVTGGVVLLGGIILHGHSTGSLLFGPIGEMGTGTYLILAGFLLNAAVPPLNAWLTDA